MANATTSWSPTWEDGDKDVARTFAESGLTLTHSGTAVSSESLKLVDAGTTATVHNAETITTNTGQTGRYGLKINPNKDLAGIVVTLNANMSPSTDSVVKIKDSSEIDIISVDVSAKSGGDTVKIEQSLSAGTTYYVAFRDPGGETIPEWSESYPISTTDIDVTAGYNGADQASTAYCFDAVQANYTATSGTVYAEWSMPDDIYGWDQALFQRTLAGETVNIYVEENSGSWTEIAGPISRTDTIPADPGNNVRYRVDISRASTANNPTIDMLARRWTL